MKKLIILFLSLFVIWGSSSAFESSCAWRDVFPSLSPDIGCLSPEVLGELRMLVLASSDRGQWGRLVNNLSRKECVRELCDGMCRLGANKKSPAFHLCVQAYIRAHLSRIKHDEGLVCSFLAKLRKHPYLRGVSDFYVYANLTREERCRFNKFFNRMSVDSVLSMLGENRIVQFAENDSFTDAFGRPGSSALEKFKAACNEGYLPFERYWKNEASYPLLRELDGMDGNFIPGARSASGDWVPRLFIQDEECDFPRLFGAIVTHNMSEIMRQLYHGASPFEEVMINRKCRVRGVDCVCRDEFTTLERTLTMPLCDEGDKDVCNMLLRRALVLDPARLESILDRLLKTKKFRACVREKIVPGFLEELDRIVHPMPSRIEVERVPLAAREEERSMTGEPEREDKGKEEIEDVRPVMEVASGGRKRYRVAGRGPLQYNPVQVGPVQDSPVCEGEKEGISAVGESGHMDNGKEEIVSGGLFLKPRVARVSGRTKRPLVYKVASNVPRFYEERKVLMAGESEHWAVSVTRAQEELQLHDHDVAVKKSKGCHCTIL